MIDWHRGMKQTYDFFRVDPHTWNDVEKITDVENCRITHDDSTDTKYSASLSTTLDPGEIYIRVYLNCTQMNENTHIVQNESFALGTFLIQTGSDTYNGKRNKQSLIGYSPLLELKDDKPPVGFSILKDEGLSIEQHAYNVCTDSYILPRRLHISPPSEKGEKLKSHYICAPTDTYLQTANNLLVMDKKQIDIDEYGRVVFKPIIPFAAMRPVYIFNDDNSSILYPDVSREYDIYGIPNVVEVIYSDSGHNLRSEARCEDPNNPLSLSRRGRVVRLRITDPEFKAVPTQQELDMYAEQTLEDAMTVERTITIKHGFCNVRAGECIEINYERRGLKHIKAKIKSQNISCEKGTPVESVCTYREKIGGIKDESKLN